MELRMQNVSHVSVTADPLLNSQFLVPCSQIFMVGPEANHGML